MESYLAVRQRIDTIRSHFVGRPTTSPIASGDRAFAHALSAAGGTAGAGQTVAAADRGTPPLGYQGISNGMVPDEMLVDIGDGHRLHPAAAVQFDEMRTAMAADGIEVEVVSSYRTRDHQQRLVDQLGLYSDGGLAAAPGHSNHGWGISVDLEGLGADATAWLQQNAGRFGWVNDVPREPWHWTFTGQTEHMEIDLR